MSHALPKIPGITEFQEGVMKRKLPRIPEFWEGWGGGGITCTSDNLAKFGDFADFAGWGEEIRCTSDNSAKFADFSDFGGLGGRVGKSKVLTKHKVFWGGK